MSARQLYLLLVFAGMYLAAQVVVWLGYAVFLYSKGRL